MILKIKDNVDLKELEKYGWKIDMTDCIYTCKECKQYCFPKKEQYYIKQISNILPYTSIFVNGIERKIYGVYDEFHTIDFNDKRYKYIIMACQEEINVGLIENLEEDK